MALNLGLAPIDVNVWRVYAPVILVTICYWVETVREIRTNARLSLRGPPRLRI